MSSIEKTKNGADVLATAATTAGHARQTEIGTMLANVQNVLATFPKIVETLNEMKSQAAERDITIAQLQEGSRKTEAELERLYQESRKSSGEHTRKLDELAQLLRASLAPPRAGVGERKPDH